VDRGQQIPRVFCEKSFSQHTLIDFVVFEKGLQIVAQWLGAAAYGLIKKVLFVMKNFSWRLISMTRATK
jgi:hypothetical protein